MSDLFVTDVGRAVARSALMPRTAAYFLDYFRDNLEKFYELLRQTAQIYDEQPEKIRLWIDWIPTSVLCCSICAFAPQSMATTTQKLDDSYPIRWEIVGTAIGLSVWRDFWPCDHGIEKCWP